MDQQNTTPRLINWAGYIALTLLLVLPLSVLTVRSGAWQQGLMLYALACLGSTLLMILLITLLLLPRFSTWRKGIFQRALLALPGTALLLGLASGGELPQIHDITTDTADPPLFTAAPQQRGSSANSLEINEDVIALQLGAYPEMQSLLTPLPLEEAFNRALQIAAEMGWEVYRQDLNAGAIEAVDTTAIMSFKDDIIIRVRSNAQGTLVDLRSVSRVGEGDLGANAKRIHAFLEAFQRQG
jgi:hypothetical protein